jgi:hypothetical protein
MAEDPKQRISAHPPPDALPVPEEALRRPLSSGAHAPLEAAVAGTPVPSSGVSSTGIEARAKFTDEVHQYIREYIRLADQKATFFFTGGTALLAFLYKNDVSSRWLKPILTWNVIDTVAFAAMVALALAAFLAILVVIPRTPGSRRGFVFWEAIAEYESGRHYADELASLSPASLAQAKAEHCFDIAKVCRRKYRVLKYAIWSGTVGLVASLLLFLFV